MLGGTNPPMSGDLSAATHPLQFSNTGLVRQQQQQQQLAAVNNSNNNNGGLLTQQLNNNGGLLSQQLNNNGGGMMQQQQQCSPGGQANQQDQGTPFFRGSFFSRIFRKGGCSKTLNKVKLA